VRQRREDMGYKSGDLYQQKSWYF